MYCVWCIMSTNLPKNSTIKLNYWNCKKCNFKTFHIKTVVWYSSVCVKTKQFISTILTKESSYHSSIFPYPLKNVAAFPKAWFCRMLNKGFTGLQFTCHLNVDGDQGNESPKCLINTFSRKRTWRKVIIGDFVFSIKLEFYRDVSF